MSAPRVYSIPAGECFVDRLVEGIRARHGATPLALAEVEILVPTRRAVRSLCEAFLRASEGRATLLPVIRQIGDVDEDGLIFEDGAEALTLPPAIAPLERQLLLARLVHAERARTSQPIDMAQALWLAGELASLLDRLHTERADPARLETLAPADFAEHWQLTLDFLAIVTAHWPKILAERGALDPTDRRDRLISGRAASWRQRPPTHPVIAAGSTGSIPATAELLAVVAQLPAGAVVLPGLDTAIDDAAWEAIEPSHPQAGLKNLLTVLGVDRISVEPWIASAGATPRARAIATALGPASVVDFSRQREATEAALADLVAIDAPSARDEAEAIALLMRGALETPGRSAALITPDRALARRVAGALARWSIMVDDSAGRPLARTPIAAFFRLLAQAASEPDDPIALLALLKHPLARAGEGAGAHKAALRALDLALRGPRPAAPLQALAAKHPAAPWAAKIGTILEPLATALTNTATDLPTLIRAHVEAAEALAEEGVVPGRERLWVGDEGEAFGEFVAEIERVGTAGGPMGGASYLAALEALLGGRVLRPRYGAHPRLAIWGLLEARLQRTDLLILGGLNEDVWPARIEADPWMSRAMAKALGLAPPERRVGLSAHDFVQAASSPEIVLSRAARIEGAPSVASRWLRRLEAAAPIAFASARAKGDVVLSQARALDQAEAYRPTPQPAPTPRIALRPKSLSVTEIETWMRDPYAIYARHVLGLKALDPIDADPGAAESGIFIHAALADFVGATKGRLPEDALAKLLAAGRKAFASVEGRPGLHAFWWPRFERIADWFVEHERSRLGWARPIAVETTGTLKLGTFELRGRADRFDRLADGGLAIIDYKTGRVPKSSDVALGFAPQLTLEGAMAEASAFGKVAGGKVASLEHWRLGGRQSGEVHALKDGPALIPLALAGLRRLIAAFADPATPYRAVPHPGFAPAYSDYRHLERIDEWSGPQSSA